MSIEAQALTALIQELDTIMTHVNDTPQEMRRRINWASTQAKYWVQPLQMHMDVANEVWNYNKDWSRYKLLKYMQDLPNLWVLRSFCLGNMNFNVENEGFLGWAREGFDTPIDWEVLVELATRVKTPVGGNVLTTISAVRNCLASPGFNSDDPEDMEDSINDLSVFTKSYLSLRYEFMVQVEALIRADVPNLHTRPFFVVK